MSRSGFICFLYMLMTGTMLAQEHLAVSHIPENLKARANAVMRDQQWTIDMRAPNEVVLQVKQVLTIMNNTALEYARLAILYDKSTVIKTIQGAVYDEFGNLIKKINAKDLVDESAVSSFSLYEDNRVKHYLPHVMEYPFTVVYNYEVKFKQNLIIPDWVPDAYRDMAIERSSYNFLCNATDHISMKEVNYDGPARVEEKSEKQKSYTWLVEGIPATKREPLSPPADTYQTRVKIAAQDFFYYRKKGTYTNWQELGRWVYTDLIKERQAVTPAMQAKVQSLLANVSDDREKVKILYRYLQEKTRYISVQIGIGGFQPMAASDVDRLGYGDCKGLVNYMQALLSIAELPSYYCVVNAGNIKKDIDKDFASMSQGNHVILAVPLQQDTIWLECTSQKLPFGFLGDFTDDRLVLACAESGGKLLHTPKFNATESLQKREAALSLTPNGDILGNCTTRFMGAQYDNRLLIKDLPSFERLKTLKEVYPIDNIDFENTHYKVESSEIPYIDEQLKNVAIKQYAPKNGSRVYLQPNIFNRISSVPNVSNRTLPLYINRAYMDEDYIVYTIPENYTIELKPANVDLDTDFGRFVMELKQVDNTLVYRRKIVTKEGVFPADRYADYVKFVHTIYGADVSKVVFLEQ